MSPKISFKNESENEIDWKIRNSVSNCIADNSMPT